MCSQILRSNLYAKGNLELFQSNLIAAEVGPPGFEPGSWDPEPHMMDRYTKGLSKPAIGRPYFNATAAQQRQSLLESATLSRSLELRGTHHQIHRAMVLLEG